MTSGPEWGDFRVLLALSHAGSVAGAARALGVDGSTVSRRLAALEESIGHCLIVRGGREFSWTEEGRAAVSCAEKMECAVDSLVRSCRESKLDAGGAVRVSFPPAFVPVVLDRMMPALRQSQPALKLELRGDFRRVDLGKGEADIAVRMARPTETDLVARRALECGWCLYGSVSYSGTRGMPTSMDALKDHHLILYEEAMHGVEALRWLESYRGGGFVRVDNLELAVQLVSAGTGIGVLPTFFEAFSPGLVRVFPEPVTCNTGFIVYHESVRERARVRAAVDALADFFASEGVLFSGRSK